MSLQVWLPFTDGTLKQQGLSSAAATSGGTVNLTNVGKLGKCATLGTAAGGITLPASTMTSFTKCSVAFWVKIISWNTSYATLFQAGLGSTPWNNYIFGILRNNANSNLCFTLTNSSSSSTNASYVSSNLEVDQWYHLAFVYNTGVCKIYINGVEDKSYNTSYVPNFAGITNISIGRCTNGSSYQTNCSLNDFRIYDHALSPMEVKRISQGLVLHYPLNREGWGQENLVWNSNWNTHSTIPPEGWVNWGSPPTREIVTIDGKNWLHVISNTANFQGYSQNWTKRNGIGELTANTKMTISFTAKLAVAASIAPIGIHWCNSSGTIVTQNWTTTALTTSPKRYSFTYTTPADCVAFNIMVGDNTNTAHEVWVTDVKLEFGEIATPWCPNSSDTLATTMGLNGTTEYDTSGFCNNGTRTGTFSWTSDTPKYSVSSVHTGSNYIYLDSPPTETQTIAVWVKWNTIPSGQSVILVDNGSGIGLGLMSTGILCSTSKAGNSYTFSKANLVANTWYHFVIVKTGTTTRKLYINGVEQTATSNTSNWTYSVDQLQLGKRSTTSDGFAGKLCDFRAYATALSAEDVKSLYQNCATIDPDGTIRGQIRS